MDRQLLIKAFDMLALEIIEGSDQWNDVIHKACGENRWFDPESINTALQSLAINYFNAEALTQWLAQYDIGLPKSDKFLGLILAGNIPLVGMHDIIVGLFAGYKLKIKMSDKDKVLLPYLVERLDYHSINTLNDDIELVDKLKDIDVVICTGSNNSAMHFEHYFAHLPRVIRKNRVSVAILNGQEDEKELKTFGQDIFYYYGLGCRNVTMVYVPQDYDVTLMLQAWDGEFDHFTNHNKYRNNYDYNLTMYIMNSVEVLANKQIVLKEDESLHSRIGVLHYTRYKDAQQLIKIINQAKDEIQCVVGKAPIEGLDLIGFGCSQSPQLSDYADNIDTMAFLIENSKS